MKMALKKLLKNVIEKGLFKIELINKKTIFDSNIIIVAVGTPNKNDKIDLSHIIEVSKQIGNYIKKTDDFISIIIKSTVLPGTTDSTIKPLIEKESGKKLGRFGLGMNPEFLRVVTRLRMLFILIELYWDLKIVKH